MSVYRYTLSDYHAVGRADILIDRITVLAGENGCGKSTLSRWLYYLVNGSNRMDEFLYKNYIRTIYSRIDRMVKVTNDIYRQYPEFNSTEDTSQTQSTRQILRKLRMKSSPKEEDSARAFDLFVKQIHDFGDLLGKYLDKVSAGPQRERILFFLDLESDEAKDGRQIAEDFIESNIQLLNHTTEQLNKAKLVRKRASLFDIVRDHFEETDEAPNAIQFFEDNVELLPDDSVSTLFNLQRAIYIDTPMALVDRYSDNVFWKELVNLMYKEGVTDDITSKKLIKRVKNVIHGEAKIVSEDSPFADNELRYISADNRVNIEIEKTATGFKTFTYIQRLLENGLLNSDTLLLIDEPEAHLHPQWIVEYARLLVLISKELGLKVMLASHNPDMVAAIKAISEREGMLEHTHFYLAKNSEEEGYRYEYKDLGSDISEIFTSFNIALSRIKAYGPSDI